ncbi:MAG: 4Fe-4S dicluster domain-containing protein [Bryobacteraceae bacterium]
MVKSDAKTGPPIPATHTWHRARKAVHLACFLAFLALPFFNIVRADIPRQRFYFAGYELWINEFGIIFFALMFLMFLIVASSVFYGRVYCGYLCPQMIFSEASVVLDQWLRRWVMKRFIHWTPRARQWLYRAALYGVLAAASVVLAFVFISYFVEPHDLLRRLASFDVRTAGGVSGAVVTLITFLDFALVRQRFCTTVCPYGYLQGLLGDGHTLLVHYRDEGHACIECKKCVRVCPMGIDIRQSPFQIECIHCAECIDACDEILGRLGKPGLIHYVWGEQGPLAARARQPWDAKRLVVLLVLLFYASGLSVALSMRHAVLVEINRVNTSGEIANRFRFSIANRGQKPTAVVFSIQQLAGGRLELQPNPVAVAPGQSAQGEFEITAPPATGRELVTHFTLTTTTVPGRESDAFPLTFLATEKQ